MEESLGYLNELEQELMISVSWWKPEMPIWMQSKPSFLWHWHRESDIHVKARFGKHTVSGYGYVGALLGNLTDNAVEASAKEGAAVFTAVYRSVQGQLYISLYQRQQ